MRDDVQEAKYDRRGAEDLTLIGHFVKPVVDPDKRQPLPEPLLRVVVTVLPNDLFLITAPYLGWIAKQLTADLHLFAQPCIFGQQPAPVLGVRKEQIEN